MKHDKGVIPIFLSLSKCLSVEINLCLGWLDKTCHECKLVHSLDTIVPLVNIAEHTRKTSNVIWMKLRDLSIILIFEIFQFKLGTEVQTSVILNSSLLFK